MTVGAENRLQRLEIGSTVRHLHHHLAVEHGALHGKSSQLVGQHPVVPGPILVVAGVHLHFAVVEAAEDPVAVKLHLVQPGVALRRLRDQRGQLGADEAEHRRGGAGALQGRRVERELLSGMGVALLVDETVAMPHARLPGGGDLLEGAPAGHRAVLIREEGPAVAVHSLVVPVLDQQPVLLVPFSGPGLHAHQHPTSLELLSLEGELQIAPAQSLVGIAHRLPDPAIPELHGPSPVLALGDGPFEAAVLERMVFHPRGQMPVLGIEGRPFGHGPGQEDAVEFESEVVVQPARGVLLDDERKAAAERVRRCLPL